MAESDGRIVGFIGFADGWVNHLYIDPHHQRRGLGRRLLELATHASDALQLWVFQANTPAIRFYERVGFYIALLTDGAANEARQPDARMERRKSV